MKNKGKSNKQHYAAIFNGNKCENYDLIKINFIELNGETC